MVFHHYECLYVCAHANFVLSNLQNSTSRGILAPLGRRPLWAAEEDTCPFFFSEILGLSVSINSF